MLVLDEPTNDLDLETLELLEAQLVEWPGTLLLVSHDRAFLDNVVTSTFVFEGDGRVQEYVGGLRGLASTTERPVAPTTEEQATRRVSRTEEKDSSPVSPAEKKNFPSRSGASSSSCRRGSRRSRRSSAR